MNVDTKYTGEVTFTVSRLESFPANMSIKLEDKLSGQMINLRQQPSYIFAHQAENEAGRFILHFNGATAVDESPASDGNIWIFHNTVNIYTPASIEENALVEIFNAAGKVVFSLQVTLSELTRIPVSLSGFAVIRVTDFTCFKIIGWGWYYLSTVVDDYSRYIITWELRANMTSEDVNPSITKALQLTGLTKNTVPKLLSVNGPCYKSADIKSFLKDQGIKPINGKPCHPQTQGKIERYHRRMKNVVKL